MRAWFVLGVIACGRVSFDSRTPDSSLPFLGPSCQGLAPTCGAGQTGDCCESLYVPDGAFYRSHDRAADALYASQAYPATVTAFYLDRYEVTVGRFKQFIAAGQGVATAPPAAGAGAHPLLAASGWNSTWKQYLAKDAATLETGLASCVPSTWGRADNLPLNCVNWYEAFAFCAWDGGYLPTEAEWNFAASGGDEQRAYPWSVPPESTTIDCTYANTSLPSGYCVGDLEPVGAHSPQSDGRWGHADLAGNVWEKVLDYYVGDSAGGYANASCSDCANLAPDTTRAVRGGGWNGDHSVARVAYRYYDPPMDRYIEMGMRCARPQR